MLARLERTGLMHSCIWFYNCKHCNESKEVTVDQTIENMSIRMKQAWLHSSISMAVMIMPYYLLLSYNQRSSLARHFRTRNFEVMKSHRNHQCKVVGPLAREFPSSCRSGAVYRIPAHLECVHQCSDVSSLF